MMLPLSQVRRLTALLMDVHGQHEHQALLNPQRHLEFLDEFGDAAHAALMRARGGGVCGAAGCAQRCSRSTELRRLPSALAGWIRLANQIAEIEAVKPKPGEEEALLRKYRLMQHAEKIAEGVKTAYALVYLGGGKTHAAQELLSRASSALGELAGIDERFGQLRDRIEEMAVNAREIGYELQDMLESMDYDERAAERVGDRLDAIHKLERKYGAQVEDVLAFLDAAKREYESLEKSDERASELRKQIAAQEKALRALCGELTQSRTIIARRLEKMLVQELSELGMAGTQFRGAHRARSGFHRAWAGRGGIYDFAQSRRTAQAASHDGVRRRAFAHHAGDEGHRRWRAAAWIPWYSMKSIRAFPGAWRKRWRKNCIASPRTGRFCA